MNAYAMPGLDLHLRAPYDDVAEFPEPTPEQFDEAFDRCVADDELLVEYVTEACYDPVSILQLLHAKGLPRMDKTFRDDQLRDRYTSAMVAFFNSYRDWLGDRLADMAQVIAQEQIESDREDA